MRTNVLTAANRRSQVACEIFQPHSSTRHASMVSLVISLIDSIVVDLTSHLEKNITPRS
jgi:hypothetical protein